MTGDEKLARAVVRDYREADLEPRVRALLDYAVVVTRDARAVTDGTIDELRAFGWDDADILTATEIVGFFNYYARMADALGIDPEGDMVRDPEVWPEA